MFRLIFCVVLMAGIPLVGCGRSDSAPKPAASSPTVVQPAVQATPPAPAANTTCAVSGEDIDPRDPKLLTAVHQGKTYGFCCQDCQDDFKKHPEKYVKQ